MFSENWVIRIGSWGTCFLPTHGISNMNWLKLRRVHIFFLYLGNCLEQGFLLRLKTQLIVPETKILHNQTWRIWKKAHKKPSKTTGCRHICGFTYMYQLPTYSQSHKQRHTVRQTRTHTYSPKKTTQWNLALSNSNLNIASGLLIDLHALAHKNMLFSLPLLALWNSFGFFRCQCMTLLVNPNLKMPK